MIDIVSCSPSSFAFRSAVYSLLRPLTIVLRFLIREGGWFGVLEQLTSEKGLQSAFAGFTLSNAPIIQTVGRHVD